MNGIQGQYNTISSKLQDAAFQWNIGSRPMFVLDNNSLNPLRSGYFQNYGISGQTCYGVNGTQCTDSLNNGYIGAVMVKFNDNANIYWNFNGQASQRTTTTGYEDFFSIALHEFGHWLDLGDNPDNQYVVSSIMSYSTPRPFGSLGMDDKEGDSMMYGIFTGFEQSQHLGLLKNNQNPVSASLLNVRPYGCGGGVPRYWTYNSGQDGIYTTAPGGNGSPRFMKFEGCSVGSGYAYMVLADAAHNGTSDAPEVCPGTGRTGCYQQINSSSKLRWLQYVPSGSSTCTVSIDLEVSNGSTISTLRDSGATDQGGRSIHPAERSCNLWPRDQWLYFEVSLSPLAGKWITKWMVAYDNTKYGATGNWRIAIDDLQFVPY